MSTIVLDLDGVNYIYNGWRDAWRPVTAAWDAFLGSPWYAETSSTTTPAAARETLAKACTELVNWGRQYGDTVTSVCLSLSSFYEEMTGKQIALKGEHDAAPYPGDDDPDAVQAYSDYWEEREIDLRKDVYKRYETLEQDVVDPFALFLSKLDARIAIPNLSSTARHIADA